MISYTNAFGSTARLEKATDGSLAYDLRSEDEFVLLPGEIRRTRTGILLDLSKSNAAGLVLPRSGLASKGIGVANSPGLIDHDYRGEVGVLLWNMTNESWKVNKGDRIAQLLFVSLAWTSPANLVYMPTDETFEKTKRGAGGFGSTGA